MNVFDLQAKISLDSGGFESGLSAAAGQMESFGSQIEGIMSKIGGVIKTGFATAAAGVSGLITGAATQFAEFEQLVGGVDTLFKESSGRLQEYADNAFRTAGMSANDYMANATSFAASLISSLGGDTDAAVEYANRAMVSMSDNANKMGTDMNSIVGTYQSLARGNFAMIDNLKLGYGGTKAELERLIADAATYTDVQREMGVTVDAASMSFDNIVNAIAVVQANLGIAGATAQEAATTIEGSVNSMKAAWSNWLVGLADESADLSGLTGNLIGSFETVVQNVQPVLGRIRDSILQVFSDLTGIDLSPVAAAFDGLQTVLSDVGTAFAEGGAAGALEEITEKLENLTGLDLSGVSGALSGIAEGFSNLVSAFSESGISGVVDEVVGALEELTGFDVSGVVDRIAGAFAGIGDAIMSNLESIDFGQYVENILGVVEPLASGIVDMFSQIDFSAVANAFIDLQTAASEAWQGIVEAIDFEAVGAAINGAVQTISGAVSSIIAAFQSDGVGGAVQTFFGIIADTFAAAGPKILEIGKSVLDGIVQTVEEIGKYIYNAMPEVMQELVDAIMGFFAAFGDYLTEFWDWMQPLVTFFKETLVDGITVAWELMQKIIVNIIEALTGLFEMFEGFFAGAAAMLRGDLEEAAAAVKTAWEGVVDFFGGVANGIMNAFGGIAEHFANIGANMFEGLKSGFENALDWIGNVGNSIKSGFKNIFDINSPSRVFAEYGKFMAQGLEVGWDGEMDSIRRTMTDGLVMQGRVDFSNSAIGRASAATVNGMFASAGGSSGGTQTINLVVDGRTLAQVVFDPLNGIIRQKGVTLGA